MKLPFTRTWYIFGLATIVVLGIISWANATYLSPHFLSKSTFIGPYAAARAFVVEGLNPYSDEAARKARALMRKATDSRDPKSPELTLPFYGILLYVPFGLIPDVSIAFGIWMTFLELITIAIPYLVWRLAEWNAPRWMLVVFWGTWLLSLFTLQPLLTGSIVILVIFLLLSGILALLYQYEEAAGILLAFTAIKPVFIWLVLLFLFWWAFNQRRWQVFFWYISTLVIFIALSFILLPDWLLQFLRSVYHALEISPLRLNLLTWLSSTSASETRLLWILIGAFGVLFFWEFVSAKNAENRRFLWSLSLVIAVSMLLNLESHRDRLLILIVPAIVILSTFEERLGKRGRLIVAGAMIGFSIAIWVLAAIPLFTQGGELIQIMTDLPDWFAIWLPTLTIAGLYWIRWWINHPLTSSLSTWPSKSR